MKLLYADYWFKPAYNCHEQGTENRLAPMIRLSTPLHPSTFPGVNTIAVARNGYRNALWICPWHCSPITNIYYDFVRHERGQSLVCFYQPVNGIYAPFRLMTTPVNDDFPGVKSEALWAMIQAFLNTLPALISDTPVNTITHEQSTL